MRLTGGDFAGVVRESAALKTKRGRQAPDVQVGSQPLRGLEQLRAAVSRDRALEDGVRGQ